jgi:predicted alpha/beta-fold hydrolase
VLAANPPIDLAACARQLCRPENRLYNWNFVRWLRGMVKRLHDRFPELGPLNLDRVRTMYDFDEHYTAPRGGFASADDYYARCSLVSTLWRIRLPGLVVHALDDPLIPNDGFLRAARPERVSWELVPHGGHIGYLSRNRWQGDHHWLDTRLVVWLLAHWGRAGAQLG